MSPDPEFTERMRTAIQRIPAGRVATYGHIALLAGNHRASRQVAWFLHSSTRRYNLPWHRVINSRGRISLPPSRGGDEQRDLLEREGVEFDAQGRVDLKRFLWRPAD